ncbi:MAG: dipicolinate synthase subunit B [Bacillota bacterium]|nr:dipicolinate synthase subunit B [Bacillota bacterium]
MEKRPLELCDAAVGWGLTGVYESFEIVVALIRRTVDAGATVRPVVSRAVAQTDTRYGRAAQWLDRFAEAAGHRPLSEIVAIEPLGPRRAFDLFVVAPCSGATMARIACALTDDPVSFAAKGHMRNGRPLLLAISTNDALGLNARNLGALLSTRGVFLVPFRQDNPTGKPTSVCADWSLVLPAMEAALAGRQLQPLLLGPAQGE